MIVHLIYSSVWFSCLLTTLRGYEVPTPIFIIHHQGFEVNLPHEYGVSSVRVEAKRNSEITADSRYDWAGRSSLIYGTHWIYTNTVAKLRTGDTLHYRLFVKNGGHLYTKVDKVYIVECNAIPQKISNTRIEIYRKGFKVTVPHSNKITRVGIIAKRNSGITAVNPDTWGGLSSLTSDNGYWVYTNSNAKLRAGDALYYRVLVVRGGQLHPEEDGVYTVKHYTNDIVSYVIPNPRIEVFRKGFKISLPDEKGITFVSFAARRYLANTIDNPATWEGLASLTKDKAHWVYENFDAELKIGETFYYGIYVKQYERFFLKVNGFHSVQYYSTSANNIYTRNESTLQWLEELKRNQLH